MQGSTGLLEAIQAGDNELVRSFIDAKADLEAKDVILTVVWLLVWDT